MKRYFALSVILIAVALVACSSKGSSAPPPTNVVATAGDSSITLTFDSLPGAEYWVFYAPGTSVTPQTCPSITGCQTLLGAVSGVVISAPPNGSAYGYTTYGAPVSYTFGTTGLTNGMTYAFSIDGRYNGGPGGAPSSSVAATPQLSGINWSSGTPIGTNDLHGVTNGTAVVLNNAAVLPGTLNSIFANVYVAVGLKGALYSSPDGINWTPIQSNPVPTQHLYAAASYSQNYIANSNTTYVAVGQGGTILWSADTINWTNYTTPTVTANDLYAITSTGTGIYVAVGANGTIIYSGSNGTSWTAATGVPALPAGTNLYGVTYANLGFEGLYVAVGTAGTILISTNANNWITVTPASPVANDLKSVAFGGTTINYGVSAGGPTPAVTTGVNTLVAVGNNGTLVTSLDNGVTWQVQTPITTANLNAVTYARQFITVGDGGVIYTSQSSSVGPTSTPAGTYTATWTPQTSRTTSPLYAIAHGRFDYSAVGGVSSPVGTTINPLTTGSGVNLHSM